jgi:polyisoprenoid-binding protein YceI
MKTPAILITALLLFGVAEANAQDLYKSNNGKVSFFSEAPLENIQASSASVSSVLKPATGEVAFTIPIRTFKFEKSLMEEHFNENYLESDKYPQATFTGKIHEKIDLQSATEQKITVDGNLTIHGVTQKRQFPVTILVQGGKVKGHSTFKVKLADHQVEIPKLVFQNIAEVIDVTLDISYAPQPVN